MGDSYTIMAYFRTMYPNPPLTIKSTPEGMVILDEVQTMYWMTKKTNNV